MLTGYVLTVPGAPVLPVAGCLDDAAAADAFRSDLVVLRVYENKVMPDPVRYAEAGVVFATAHRHPGQRVCLVGGNEPNNPFENWRTTPAGYRAWFARWSAKVKALDPTLACWWAGMSPGLDPLGWYAGWEIADGVVLHAYGLSVDELMGPVRAFRAAHPDASWMIGECNHGVGAGRVCDRDRWADEVLVPALAECRTLGCEAVLYFVFDGWTQDDATVGQATPPIARGTRIETALRTWTPPEVPMPDWYPPATRRPITTNYTPGRAGRVPLLIVHHIADGLGSPFVWFNTDRGDKGSSAHVWVSKAGNVEQYRPLGDTCWANGPVCDPDVANPVVARVVNAGQVNAQTVAVEHEGRPGDAMPPAQVAASRALTRWLAEQYAIPLDRTHVVGHYQIDRCTRANCPGPTHPWAAILSGGTPVPPNPTPPAFDRAKEWETLWKAADRWEQAGYAWMGQGIKALVAKDKGEK